MRGMFRFFKELLVLFTLIVIFCVSSSVLLDYYFQILPMREIEQLPNVNYIPVIIELREEGRLKEALDIARFVRQNPDMPGQEEALVLENEINEELNSIFRISWQLIKGAVTGKATTGANALGAIISDFFVWGDIRDLAVQGYKHVTGQETDNVIALLSSIGVLTSLHPLIDGVPSSLKVFRRIGSISSEFASSLVKISQKALKEGKVTDDLLQLLVNFQNVVTKMGFAKSAYCMRLVKSVDELSTLAKLSAVEPDAMYIILKNSDGDILKYMEHIEITQDTGSLINVTAKKGSEGVKALTKRLSILDKPLIKYPRILVKDVRLGRVQKLLIDIIRLIPGFVYVVWFLTVGSFLWVVKIIYEFFRAVILKIKIPHKANVTHC